LTVRFVVMRRRGAGRAAALLASQLTLAPITHHARFPALFLLLSSAASAGRLLVWGCNDLPAGVAPPNNITSRVIGVLTADGTVSTSQRVTNAYRDSTVQSYFRAVATVDGSGYWLSGYSTSTPSNGILYVAAGSETAVPVLTGNFINQRWVGIGPAYPGSSLPAYSPQLYVSYRDPINPATRGVHAVGIGLPRSNVTAGSTLLPGFAAHNSARCVRSRVALR
jgi:hypothetical protein